MNEDYRDKIINNLVEEVQDLKRIVQILSEKVLKNNELSLIELTTDELNFIEVWNETDLISSMDIKGYNYTIKNKFYINKDELNNVAVRLTDSDNIVVYTSRELLDLYINDDLKVFHEVALL